MSSHDPVWFELLSTVERRRLDPGTPSRIPRRPDVLIVGGGMVGLAAATYCVRHKLGSVLLVESRQLGSGATGESAGILAPDAECWTQPPAFVERGRRSLNLWRELHEERPGGVGLTDLDWLVLHPLPDATTARPDNTVDLASPDVRQLVPQLADPPGGILVQKQARINPLKSLPRLVTSVPHVATGVTVTGVTVNSGQVTGVATSHGVLSPGAVIFATGGLPPMPEMSWLPASVLKGHLISTEPSNIHLRVAIEGVATPIEGGRLLAGGTRDSGDISPDVDEQVSASIRAALDANLPAVRKVATSHAWCGFRPVIDGLPVVDRVPGLSNAWISCGHFASGILMAPLAGEAIATWIKDDAPPQDVLPLGIDRLMPPNL